MMTERGRELAEWVSFAEVKRRVPLVEVLARYELLAGMRQSGDDLVGLCPFHEETTPSFHASPTRNAFHCFGCGRKGNTLDLVALREGVPIRQAALLLQEWFALSEGPKTPTRGPSDTPRTAETLESAIVHHLTGQENRPLRFALRGLDPTHPSLAARGLTPATIDHFGLGYCAQGLHKGRIAIPIHDEVGRLVAYAGRWPGEPPEGEPKYRLPRSFHKSRVVFNLHRAGQLAKERGLLVVEGFFGVFRLHQAGYPNVVALMGSALSERQHQTSSWSRRLALQGKLPSGLMMILPAGAVSRIAQHVFPAGLWFEQSSSSARERSQTS